MNTSNSFMQVKQILKTIATIISWTLFCLLILIIGLLVYYLITTNIYATKGEKYEPTFSLYTIVSPSMEPKIKVYDVIINKKVTDKHEIKEGDIITFISTSNISKGMTVTHRVTEVINGTEGLEFRTKGDNNLTEDTDTAKAENVMGKVVMRIPQLGRLQFFIASSGGWLIVVLIPALFIIVNDIFKILKLNKAKKSLNDVNQEIDNTEKKLEEEKRKEELKNKLENVGIRTMAEKTINIPIIPQNDDKIEKNTSAKEEKIEEIPQADNSETIEEKLSKTAQLELPKLILEVDEARENEEELQNSELFEEPEKEIKKPKISEKEKLQNDKLFGLIDDSIELDESTTHNETNIFEEEKKEKNIFEDSVDNKHEYKNNNQKKREKKKKKKQKEQLDNKKDIVKDSDGEVIFESE